MNVTAQRSSAKDKIVVNASTLAEISAAVRLADALTLENKAAELSFVHINSARHTGVHAA